MSKFVAIRASAGLSMLGGLATLGLAALMAWTGFFAPAPDSSVNMPVPLKPVLLGLAIFFVLLSVWSEATGFGIFRRREWARFSIIIFAVLLVGMGASALLGTLVVPMNPRAEVPAVAFARIRTGILAFYGALAATGVWWLVLFNSHGAKDYFSGAGLHDHEGGRPISITLIAWYLLFSSLVTAFSAIVRVPGMFFGIMLTGWAALGVYSLFTAINIYLGAGLLQLHQSARVGGIVYFGLVAANSIAIFALPGFPQRIEAMQDAIRGFIRIDTTSLPLDSFWIFGLAGAALAAVPIWFLVRRSSAFA